MVEKRYYQRDFEELYYIIDSNVISEKEFDEKEMYDGYTAFEDSMTGEEIVDLLNKLHEENERLKEYNNKLMKQPLLFDVQTIPNTMKIIETNSKLEKENEELKQQNEFLKKRCNEYWEEAGLNNDYFE